MDFNDVLIFTVLSTSRPRFTPYCNNNKWSNPLLTRTSTRHARADNMKRWHTVIEDCGGLGLLVPCHGSMCSAAHCIAPASRGGGDKRTDELNCSCLLHLKRNTTVKHTFWDGQRLLPPHITLQDDGYSQTHSDNTQCPTTFIDPGRQLYLYY